ncbi:MAG TPA: hypothetical protein VEI95_06175 [Acidobacteriota bacterium]|nr:hypothetical protein [Acidobacteriota bacterium]
MNLARFQRDISLTHQAVGQEPPNYTLTYWVTGACVYCLPDRDWARLLAAILPTAGL